VESAAESAAESTGVIPSGIGCEESDCVKTSAPPSVPLSGGPPESVDPHPGPVSMAVSVVTTPRPAKRTHDLPDQLVIRYPAGERRR